MPEKTSFIENISLRATKWIGSTASLVTHTVIFVICGIVILAGVPVDRVLLVLTTIVSLEAIYLSIFIQMSVNRNESKLEEVSDDIEEIQEDVEGIEQDVDEIQKDIDEIQEDVDEIHDEIEDDPDTKHLEHIKKTLGALIKEMEMLHSHTQTPSKKKKE
ncbi:MAG: hypothetical protein JWM20_500 [Patescibacteria group bacterium]|nr:hypothetical protein [Patescibacteria group bacterium]